LGLIQIFIISIIFISLFQTSSLFYPISADSTWEKSTDKDFNNGTLINLTIIDSGENAKLSLDLSNVGGWTEKQPQVSPSPRYYHAMAPIYGTKKVLLFGGDTSNNYNNETWLYDLETNIWIQEYHAVCPAPRMGHAMAAVDGDDKVVLFGGWGPADNGTWIYDLSDHTWENKTPTPRPAWRAYHAMATIHGKDKIILQGGYQGMMTFFDETWIYDINENKWTQKTLANSPDGIYNHAMAAVCNTDNVVHYGGGTGGGLPSTQTWIYDAGANTWIQKVPTNNPNVRTGHQMATINGTDKVLLYGGTNWGSTYLDETWIYDYSDNTWTEQDTKNKPKSPYGHALSSIWGKDEVLLFGGDYGPSNNNTWVFKYFLPELNGTYISTPYDTGVPSEYYDLDLDFKTPANTSIKLQLRTAQNLSELLNQSYVGPNGNSNTFYNTSSTPIWSGHKGDRFVQYRVLFEIFDHSKSSPTLNDVKISYNCLPEIIVLDPVNGSLLTSNNPTFTWTFVDLDSESQKAFQLIIDDDINFQSIDFDTGIRNIAEQSWEFPTGTDYNDMPDGTWYWKVHAKDSDDAWTKYCSPRKFNIDTHAPDSSLSYPQNYKFYYQVHNISGEASELSNGSGLNKIEIAIKCINTNTFWNGSTWVPLKTWLLTSGTEKWTYNTSAVTWNSGITYNIQSRATDKANNIETPHEGIYFNIDKRAPISKIDSPMNGYWLNRLNTISGSALDVDSSGLAEVELNIKCTIDNDNIDGSEKGNDYWSGSTWDSDEVWLLASGTEQWSYNTSNILWSTGNQYSIRSRAVDKKGNAEEPGHGISFFFDEQKPEHISIQINNNDEFTTITEVGLFLQASDVGSGVSEMSFSLDGSNWMNWEKFNNNRSFILPIGDGNKSISFRVRDHTGNIADPETDSIILDSIPPSGLQVSINDNDKYTNSSNVKLSLQGFDTLSGITDMAFSNDGVTWQFWESFQSTKSISLLPGDGKRKIFFKLRDKAGNVAEFVTDSIIVDSESPHSLSIQINNGATVTNSTLVSLQIKAVDDISGLSQISFSSDGKAWSSWENYSGIKDYSLPELDGAKIVYFRVKDNAGNIAEPESATIILDTIVHIDDERKPQKQSSGDLELWPYLFLIIIIFGIIISGLSGIYIKNRRTEHNLVYAGILPIKPGETLRPVKAAEELLPPTSAMPSLHQIPSAADEKVPVLTSTTVPSIQPLPLLPPAKDTQNINNRKEPILQVVHPTSTPPPPEKPVETNPEPIQTQDNIPIPIQKSEPGQAPSNLKSSTTTCSNFSTPGIKSTTPEISKTTVPEAEIPSEAKQPGETYTTSEKKTDLDGKNQTEYDDV
jgi:hypothetical protein